MAHKNTKEELIEEISDYLKDEDFPTEHLRAILKIINYFNWSGESEKLIFDFSKQLNSKLFEDGELNFSITTKKFSK